MPYSAEISRRSPGLIVFLLDQSGSMGDNFGNDGVSKAQASADVLNRFLQELILKCTRGEGEVRDYFDISVIGYGAQTNIASSILGADVVKISQLQQNPVSIEKKKKKVPDGAGGIVEVDQDFPIWVTPTAGTNTPMGEALNHAHQIIGNWISNNPHSYPPILINITDGEASDQPESIAEQIKQMSTSDGNVVVWNCHITGNNTTRILFPSDEGMLPDQIAQSMFRMSSIIPQSMVSAAKETFSDPTISQNINQNSRTFAYNSDLIALIQFVDIGTRTSLR